MTLPPRLDCDVFRPDAAAEGLFLQLLKGTSEPPSSVW
jgi:hypothetical protein